MDIRLSFALGGALGALAVAAPAAADDNGWVRSRAGAGYDYDYAPAGYDRYGRPNDYQGDAYRHHYHGGRRYIADCFVVTKRTYRHGRPALFEGVECVDDYGCSYLLAGSTHFVRYGRSGRRGRRHGW